MHPALPSKKGNCMKESTVFTAFKGVIWHGGAAFVRYLWLM